jgi:hypothetical protein
MKILVKKWFKRSNQIMTLLAGLFALVLIVGALFLLKFVWVTFWVLVVVACSPILFAAVAVMSVGGDGWSVVVNGRPVGRHECREDAEARARNW